MGEKREAILTAIDFAGVCIFVYKYHLPHIVTS